MRNESSDCLAFYKVWDTQKKKTAFLTKLTEYERDQRLGYIFTAVEDVFDEKVLNVLFSMMLVDEGLPSNVRKKTKTRHIQAGISVHEAMVILLEGPISDILLLERLQPFLASTLVLSCETYVSLAAFFQ